VNRHARVSLYEHLNNDAPARFCGAGAKAVTANNDRFPARTQTTPRGFHSKASSAPLYDQTAKCFSGQINDWHAESPMNQRQL
jgi:hypothetical protein